ncbi:hypothetical protein ACFYY8_17475 [Streptosporangium sp. NPDC001559]|uniref:hypothetical protein n=1 Tax=Streptosporangium sp. NPDC001559 TaxID=3366187 RepID=UPI0036E71DFD
MVELKDIAELEVLHKALMSARFADAPSDPVLLGSPYLALIHSSILDEIVDHYRRNSQMGIAARWDKWRELSVDRREWEVVRRCLSQPDSGWARLPSDELKRDLIRTCFEPFRASSALVDRMVEEIDHETSNDG